MDCRWIHIVSPESIGLSDDELLRSLNDIYGWQKTPEPYESNLIRQCEEACAIPIEEIKLCDLNTLVMQGIGLSVLLKIAIPIIEVAPWIETENYPGDLVVSLLVVDDEINALEPNYIKRIGASARRLLAISREEQQYHNNRPENWDEEFWAEGLIKDLEKYLSKWSLNAN